MNHPKPIVNDDALFRPFSKGNIEAFHLLYEKHWQLTYFNARKGMEDSEAAIDIAQAIFTYHPSRAFEQLDCPYCVSSFLNANEAGPYFRRRGEPALAPDSYSLTDPRVKGSFISRITPLGREKPVNATNYKEAVAPMERCSRDSTVMK